MALALLEVLEADGADWVLRADCGTNTRHRLEIGSRVESRDGMARLADVYHVVRQSSGVAGSGPWDAAIDIRVPHSVLRRGAAMAQLVSWKDGGRAMAVSEVIDLSGAHSVDHARVRPELRPDVRAMGFGGSENRDVPSGVEQHCRAPRMVPHRLPPMATAASLDVLVGELVKLATPLVTQWLRRSGTEGTGTGGAGTGVAPGGVVGALGGLMQVLQALIGGPGADAGVSKSKSIDRIVRRDHGNRFVEGGPRHVAEPFIFGIDDAVIATLVGPLVQVLPQLLTAANNKRIELKKADNALMAGIVSDVQKRLMLDKLVESQRAAQAQGPGAEIDATQIEALIRLLGSIQTGATPPGVPPSAPESLKPAETVQAKSLRPPAVIGSRRPCHPSSRAMLEFDWGAAGATVWAGQPLPVFRRGQRMVLRLRLLVAKDAPRTPLSRAIVHLQLRDAAHPQACIEKTFKLRDVRPDVPIECDFDAAELASLPEQVRLAALAQIRWPRGDAERCASAGADIVLVGPLFLREVGGDVDSDRQPSDMNRYRSFWNKVWQSSVAPGDAGGRLWELDVQARFTTLVDNRHDSNALMQTRLLAPAPTPGAVRLRTEGRMKAGIELSLAELNRLLPLWNGRPPLAAEALAALGAQPMLADAAREAYGRIRLKGRAGQTGMVWALPVLRLRGYTLSRVVEVDDSGRVRATAEESLAFPMPVAIRVMGLTSTS